MPFVGMVMLLLFIIAQGAAVLVTAHLGLRLLKASGRHAKAAAMTISYCFWVTATVVGYGLLGGEGGLMDGFGLVLFLCFTAFVSSFVFLIGWLLEKPRVQT